MVEVEEVEEVTTGVEVKWRREPNAERSCDGMIVGRSMMAESATMSEMIKRRGMRGGILIDCC
jgi:hypothetical protein